MTSFKATLLLVSLICCSNAETFAQTVTTNNQPTEFFVDSARYTLTDCWGRVLGLAAGTSLLDVGFYIQPNIVTFAAGGLFSFATGVWVFHTIYEMLSFPRQRQRLVRGLKALDGLVHLVPVRYSDATSHGGERQFFLMDHLEELRDWAGSPKAAQWIDFLSTDSKGKIWLKQFEAVRTLVRGDHRGNLHENFVDRMPNMNGREFGVFGRGELRQIASLCREIISNVKRAPVSKAK